MTWDAMFAQVPCVLFSPFSQPEGAEGMDAGARPGVIFSQVPNHPQGSVFQQLVAQQKLWESEGRRLVVAARTRVADRRADVPAGRGLG